MNIHTITVCYMEPSTVAWALMRYLSTDVGSYFTRASNKWILVNNYWPYGDPQSIEYQLRRAALLVQAEFIRPLGGKNVGGHGGFNLALSCLPYEDDDMILGYDPDSNPTVLGWVRAMETVMMMDPSLGGISLMPAWIKNKPGWNVEMIGGHRVAFRDKPEMYNVTAFRGSFLRSTQGLQAQRPFYGHVEREMHCRLKEQGLRHGHLFDFIEEPCPIPHPKKYQDWKGLHSAGLYVKNFDDYLKENP